MAGQQLFTFPSRMSPAAYKTYAIRAPLATHWHTVSCADDDCEHYALGWDSVIDEGTDLGKRQAHYIRKESGRRYSEERQPDGLTRFKFEAGQKCFREHKARNQRPERYIERGGDWNHAIGPRREFARPDEWVDSFANHQFKLRDIVERGLCTGRPTCR